MKRFGNLFSSIVDYDNLLTAHLNARKGKSQYGEVQMVNRDTEMFIAEIQRMLISKTFTTSPYELKEIYEPKKRTIYKLPYYPDRIVQHAVMQVIQPIWDKIFIYDLYSAIPGKGLHAGSYRLRKFLKDVPNTQYCLKFDISKFYPSMNHDVLLNLIEKKIKCKDTLWLLEDVIRSTPGVPIGNYLSQYFGNIYMNEFDHWLKEDKGMRYYLRYCDDGVILHADLQVLKDLLVEIREKLEGLHLTLNPKTSIIPVDRCGVDFLGYRHYRGHTLLRKSAARNMKKKVAEIERHGVKMRAESVVCSVMSIFGWLKHCNSFHLTSRYLTGNKTLCCIMDLKSAEMGITNPMRSL